MNDSKLPLDYHSELTASTVVHCRIREHIDTIFVLLVIPVAISQKSFHSVSSSQFLLYK